MISPDDSNWADGSSIVANHNDMKSPGELDLKDNSFDLGILGEILGSEGSYLDTDFECDYDEENEIFVKTSRSRNEEPVVSSIAHTRQIDTTYSTGAEIFDLPEDGLENRAVSVYSLEELLKRFTTFAVALGEVGMPKEMSDEQIARLWDLHRRMNLSSLMQLLVILKNSK